MDDFKVKIVSLRAWVFYGNRNRQRNPDVNVGNPFLVYIILDAQRERPPLIWSDLLYQAQLRDKSSLWRRQHSSLSFHDSLPYISHCVSSE